MPTQDCFFCDGRPGGCRHCDHTGIEPPSEEQKARMHDLAIATIARFSEDSRVLYREPGGCIVYIPGTKSVQAVCGSDVKVGDVGRLIAEGHVLRFKREEK